MQYRRFGNTGWDASILGFGIMRMPTIKKPSPDGKKALQYIDEEMSTDMVRYAIDNGVNYIDTAYMYHYGQSESFVGRVLRDGYREKVKVATKLPPWSVKSSDDFDRLFDEQRSRLQIETIDLYLLHALKREWWENLRGLGILKWAEKMISDGHIGHLGFSFHDDYPVFKDIIDGYDAWDFCQIQYNFMDPDFQAGERGLRYAAEKGLAVVVMEPLRGGQLTLKPPDEVARFWSTADLRRSQADWAFQWLWDQPEVSVVLSGMTTMDQVKENIESAGKARLGGFTEFEHALIHKVRVAYKERSPIPCTECRYCMPCPNGVDIPGVFRLYNSVFMYDDIARPRFSYTLMDDAKRADKCISCGECEEHCPQGIPISEWMPKVHEKLKK